MVSLSHTTHGATDVASRTCHNSRTLATLGNLAPPAYVFLLAGDEMRPSARSPAQHPGAAGCTWVHLSAPECTCVHRSAPLFIHCHLPPSDGFPIHAHRREDLRNDVTDTQLLMA